MGVGVNDETGEPDLDVVHEIASSIMVSIQAGIDAGHDAPDILIGALAASAGFAQATGCEPETFGRMVEFVWGITKGELGSDPASLMTRKPRWWGDRGVGP